MIPILDELNQLKAQWIAAQPLKPEDQARLDRKFRLEWNFNSNHIEGNTLTYSETELLLIHGQTKGSHTMREYDEMKAHNVAVIHVMDLAEKRLGIGETDIRNWHRILLKEPFTAEALTVDGKPTQVEIIPGAYKSLPNNVLTATGEIFYYATPTDTPPRMEALVAWLRAEMEKPTMHPIEFASKLHHDFLLIHPFADGNGRVARLLANYVLLREGFPPIIIKSADKKNYIAALRVADVGDLGQLTDYLARQMKWSLDLALNAARGQSIEEPDDVEKEITLLIRQEEARSKPVLIRSPDAVLSLLNNGLREIFTRFQEKLKKLEPLFTSFAVSIAPRMTSGNVTDWRLGLQEFAALQPRMPDFVTTFTFRGYRAKASTPFDFKATIRLHCDAYRYQIRALERTIADKLYSEPLTSSEIEAMTSEALKRAFEEIKKKAG